MLKDIIIPNANHCAIAIASDDVLLGEWKVYLINHSDETLHNLIINSSGHDAEGRITSTLRHYREIMEPKSFSVLEIIMPELFELKNSFALSYYIGTLIHYVEIEFPENSITIETMQYIDMIEKPGHQRFY